MKFFDLMKDAISNTARNKVRTFLTIIAIFIGAFTLTITNSIGVGVSTYINSQVNSIGSPTIMTVSNPPEEESVEDAGPQKYEPSAPANPNANFNPEDALITEQDITAVSAIDNVEYVERIVVPRPTYIMSENSERYVPNINLAASITIPDVIAGAAFNPQSEDYEVLLPASYVKALGFASNEAAVGQQVTFGVTDYSFQEHTVTATVAGVQNKSLFAETISLNSALAEQIATLQDQGLPPVNENDKTYLSVIIHFPENLSADKQTDIKNELEGLGLAGTTVADQLGSVNAVINGIIGVLNAFAVIALIAAGFGIVNTLLMSVQERTREIGLMKAMGMDGKKIYLLFSLEAVFIGFLGSALGAGAAIGVGTGVSTFLSNTILADLPGLTVTLFTVPSVVGVILLVMFIAFLAGTIPAQRAAKQNPIDALRYE